MTNYQYQVDYGSGYEDVFPEYDAASNQEQLAAAWLATVEAEGDAHRARVLSGGQVVAERVFDCALVESLARPDGSIRHLVHCAGGEVVVHEGADGSLSGSIRSGYVGDADQAVESALEAVRVLKKQ